VIEWLTLLLKESILKLKIYIYIYIYSDYSDPAEMPKSICLFNDSLTYDYIEAMMRLWEHWQYSFFKEFPVCQP
jgi:hypothetical protein